MPLDVAITVAGGSWESWSSYELTSDFLVPADGWVVEGFAPSSLNLAAITLGLPVIVSVGGAPVMHGVIESIDTSHTEQGLRLTLGGRDLVGGLVDCSPGMLWSWRSMSLAAVAQQACAELGLAIVVQADAEAQVPLNYIKADPGETYWSVLQRTARRLRMMLWLTPAGVLRIGRPDYLSPPVATLVHNPELGQSNVKEFRRSQSLADRFTQVTVVGQTAGGDALFGATAAQLTGVAVDPQLAALGIVRTTTIDPGDVESMKEAEARARWEISRRNFDGETLELVVAGHGPLPSVLWEPDQLVTIVDAVAGASGLWWISKRRFLRDAAEGTRTALTLHPPNLLLPAV